MNREQIEQWADEVSMCCEYGYEVPLFKLEEFARLVAAHQREVDAKVCEREIANWCDGEFFAAAIRKGES